MIKVTEMAFTGYPATDKQKARDFYEGIFNLQITVDCDSEAGFWIVYEMAGGTLALSNMWKTTDKPGPHIALEVEDFAESVDTLKAKGVRFVGEPFETPVSHIAIVVDPDGNPVMVHKRKLSIPDFFH
jgi:predicted enzyme related to lactoylglutathione lyase